MYNQGFLKAEMATPNIVVGDIDHNKNAIIKIINNSKAGLIIFPELTLTGYTASDLFFQEEFISRAQNALKDILTANTCTALVIIGLPLDINGGLFNVAVVLQGKTVLGIVPKRYLPNHQEFYEKRWFISGLNKKITEVNLFNQKVPFGKLLFKELDKKITIGVEICQDLWANFAPSDEMSMIGANVIANLSASTEQVGKSSLRKTAVLDHSRKQNTAYLYSTTGSFESTAESFFTNHKIAAVNGILLAESDFFNDKANSLVVDINIEATNHIRRKNSSFMDQGFLLDNQTYQEVHFRLQSDAKYQLEKPLSKEPFINCKTLIEDLRVAKKIQIYSLRNKLLSLPETNQKIVIGISGGLDSTLALLVSHQVFKLLNRDFKDIIAVTMPSEMTSSDSLKRALKLMDKLGVTALEIPIEKMVAQHLLDLNHQEKDVTYENAQARVRTLTLMNLANKYQGFVLGTGDLSEIALGWMTYNGDQMSMYAINSGLTKAWVKALVLNYILEYPELATVLDEVLAAKITPELLENQATEEIIGSYEVNDFILYYHIACGNSEDTIVWLVEKTFSLTKTLAKKAVENFMTRFYNNQFKRSTLPEGPKILEISLSPRGDYRFPSDVKRK